MEFLDRIYFNNTVSSYLVVTGTIIVVLLLKRYLSRYIASLLFRFVHRIWSNVAKENFTDLIVEPLEWFLVIFIAVFAIDKLVFPDILLYNIYGHSTADIASRFGIGIIIFAFFRLLLRIVDFISSVLEKRADLTTDNRDNQLIVFFRDFLKVLIGMAGVLLIIKACFNQPIGNVLTGLSIFGAALAFAAKESLENLIASFIIFFDKPFFTGDVVKVNNVSGQIEKIGLRSTRIRTPEKTLVTVPNKQMVDTSVDNLSMRTNRRAEIRLELLPASDITAVRDCISQMKEIFSKNNYPVTSYTVFLTDLNKYGIVIVMEYFTQPIGMDDFNALKETVIFSIKSILQQKSLELSNMNNFNIAVNNTPAAE